MTTAIKIILACLLLLCLFQISYGFYQFVRFTAVVGFGILAYRSNELKKQKEVLVYIALAILFQPFFKVSLGRTLWNVIDVIVGLSLLGSLFFAAKKNPDEK